jgi:hypothetical protein
MALLFRPASATFLPWLHAGAFFASGIIGGILSILIKREYDRRWQAIRHVGLP